MYQPTTRLLTVLELLESRDVVSGAEIASLLEVDVRSVRRYIVSLQDLGIPVEGTRGRGGGYRLGPGHRLAPLILGDDEAVAVVLGLLELRRGGPSVPEAAVDGALARLGRVLPAALRARIDTLGQAIAAEPRRADDRPDALLVVRLSAAVAGGRRVRIRYRTPDGPETERDVDPFGIAIVLGHWYVVGHCHLRRGLRSFRVDRILEVRERRFTFRPPDGFDALAFVTEGIATMPSRYATEVLFRAPLEEVARRMPAAYARLEARPDGIVARAPLDDLDAHARYLVGLGLPFRVVAPAELGDAVRQLAAGLIASQGEPAGRIDGERS